MQNEVRRNEEETTKRRAGILGLNFIDTAQVQKQLFRTVLSIPEMYKLKVIPLVADEHTIHFGITTTTSQQTINGLRSRFTDQRLLFSLISESGFKDYMLLYDPPKKVEYQDISINDSSAHAASVIAQVSQTLEKVRPDDMLAYLVQQAYKLKASDIHLENQKESVRVRFRVDGVLHPVAFINAEKYQHMAFAIARAANVTAGAKEPQSGHISQTYKMATGEEIQLNLRLETIPASYGMDVVMRIFNLKLELFKLDNLGLSTQESKVVNEIIRHPTGLVLIVGPTGSGKTTTLYSLLNSLNTTENKIITLEDPVEYNIPGITQVSVNGEMEGHDFAERLRALLRLDPDVIMIGEIRDNDTAKTALQGALTGHLVLSTFHASNSAAALARMLDLVGINPLFASAIRLVMAQRLVRRLDETSKQAYKPDARLKQLISEVINKFPPNIPRPNVEEINLYKPGPSQANPFGYSGQLAIREQLVMSDGIQQVLKLPADQITTETIETKAIEEGMLTMLQDGILKAISGQTSLEEIYRVVG